MAGSLTTGIVAALLLVIAPLVPAEGDAVLGVVLCGFAFGWAVLAVLSARFTDQPQRWAFIPALFLGAGGLLLLTLGSSAVLDWVWPPTLLALVIWMAVRVHRDLRVRRGRWLLYPVLAVLAIVSVGGGYETVQSAADEDYPMPGNLIDVGTHSLHLNCNGSGSPTVVLQPGGGEMSSAFGWIAPVVSEETRVCVYDRAGHGWSESSETAQDGAEIAADLHTLLESGQVPGPYVLVGHSFGGLYTLTSAALYPDEVAGMVLVDTTAPASEPAPRSTTTSDDASPDAMDRLAALLGTTARLGLGRLVSGSDFGDLPPQSRDEMRAAGATESHLRGTVEEYLTANTSGGQAAWLEDFGSKPLVVLTASVGSDAASVEKQEQLATLSDESAHRLIEGADHSALIHEEAHAAATSEAILDVVAAVRDEEPLAR
ncbi:alpha/beta fold hydrolase [Promicromonospora sp. NPDC057138]|uniref:alpha/beta fold hydrolase n=1 Tax=Promicromonospora sp. NPDC057138 TaxID=3346031 RepID=UPI0036396FB0